MIQRSGDRWMDFRPLGESGGEFDVSFWQSQSPDAIFRVAWEIVELAAAIKGH